MLRSIHDSATSNVLAWSSSHAANVESAADEEAVADADEPPHTKQMKMSPDFQRASVSRPKENKASLLTQALQSASEGEATENTSPRPSRRRSITSDISIASTAELTSDTGMSTRTNSPSPRLPDVGFVPLSLDKQHRAAGVQVVGSVPRKNGMVNQPTPAEVRKDPAVQKIEKKRCISFACATVKPKDDAAKPVKQAAPAPAPAPVQAPQPRKPCIKFACPPKPATTQSQQTPPQKVVMAVPRTEDSGSLSTVVNSPATVRKARSPVAVRRSRPSTPRRSAQSPVVIRKRRYITANSKDLNGEFLHFHEFASDHPQEEDWIREDKTAITPRKKILMDDLLKKENDIRRIAKEVEEEAELEEEEAEAEDDINTAEDDEDDNLDEDDVEDDQSGYGSDDDFSDGYNTDEDLLEYADSDDEDDDDDSFALWTFSARAQHLATEKSSSPAVFGPASLSGFLSDSSTHSIGHQRHSQQKAISTVRPKDLELELPDSTDFVCGTMDEDRPLEDAYLQRLADRKAEKLRKIPQDIDPSFPTSEPEDEEEEEEVLRSHDSAEPVWLHGELEELHAERPDRRRKSTTSPKRLRSPPPKRFHSPPPKARGRSPRRLFDRSSPKRMKSPAPVAHPTSPTVSPTQVPNGVGFNKSLAARPGLTHTKSLPRGAYFPAHLKSGRRNRANTAAKDKTAHVRGAIDIVKGLEQKRQRRKEKFQQKHCDRARKGQLPEKKAQPGEGAERMRELGLLLAGKIGQGNYVISI